MAVPDEFAEPVDVTLITGDTVTVHGATWTFQPAKGREHVPVTAADGGPENLTVMPADAGRLVAEGKLDQRLFDISYLIEHGYDDASRDDLPLLFESAAGPVRQTATAPGVEITAAYPTLGIAAVTQTRDDKHVTELWAHLTDAEPAVLGVHAEGGDLVTRWPSGVAKIWLDRFLEVNLADSVPQVGAPAAWDAGYTGLGVTVAVLDTGIDTNHPDLVGKVVDEENFTTAPDTTDQVGHGTHVAATIAGSGAASDGARRGVAPDAELMNGKVCPSTSCPTSAVLAGMSWAAGNGADIINMSLGSSPGSDGDDLLSSAVNTLTAEHGVLFVISAGNDGNRGHRQTVTTPGAADAALTVAAVDKQDRLASFSSGGPRGGDSAIKPDIAAPGVDIDAARAGGDDYFSASGTSMASPHVAGGAALLAQRHPDWSPEQLKAGLMGSATPLADTASAVYGAFEIGAGRLDVDRSVTQQVHPESPSLSFGLIEFPHDVPPTTQQATYRNDTSGDIALDLAVSAAFEGTPAPDGLFTVDTSTIIVPANGTATVDVSMNPSGVGAGEWSGQLTATNIDDDVAVSIAVGVDLEPESYDLTVNLLDRNGEPPAAGLLVNFSVFGYATGPIATFVPNGHTLRLPVGDYAVIGFAGTPRAGALDDLAQMAYPEIALVEDTSLTLDARDAGKVGVQVDRKTARPRSLETFMATMAPDGISPYFTYGTAAISAHSNLDRDLYIGSVGTSDKFFHSLLTRWAEPLIRLEVNGSPANPGSSTPVDVFYAEDTFQNPVTLLLGRHRMALVHGGAGTPDELAGIDARGNLVVLDIPPEQDAEILERIANVKHAGGRAVLLDRSALPDRRPSLGSAPALPTLLADSDSARAQVVDLSRQRGATVTTHGVADSPYQYNLFFPTEGRTPQQPVYRAPDRELGVVAVDQRSTGAPGHLTISRVWFHGRDIGTSEPIHRRSPAPLSRTEYYNPGVGWQRQTTDYASPRRLTQWTDHRPGAPTRETHFGGVIGPSFTTPPLLASFVPTRPAWAFRDGDTLDMRVTMLADTEPGHVVDDLRPPWVIGHTRLFRNGELIGANESPLGGVGAVPPDEAMYRLEMAAITNASGDDTAWEISTMVDTAWTFTSEATDQPEALPLMAVRFEPRLDEWNRAPAGRNFVIPVTVHHQPGSTDAEVIELSMEASFDDGETWQPVTVRRTGKAWRAMLTNPSDGAVSLRAFAEDADGNTVEQAIRDAYLIAPAKGPVGDRPNQEAVPN